MRTRFEVEEPSNTDFHDHREVQLRIHGVAVPAPAYINAHAPVLSERNGYTRPQIQIGAALVVVVDWHRTVPAFRELLEARSAKSE
jgi:hypothetical protein